VWHFPLRREEESFGRFRFYRAPDFPPHLVFHDHGTGGATVSPVRPTGHSTREFTMRKLILVVAALGLTVCGCRLFRDDRPSKSGYSAPSIVER
jgi:hypothetical protein